MKHVFDWLNSLRTSISRKTDHIDLSYTLCGSPLPIHLQAYNKKIDNLSSKSSRQSESTHICKECSL